MSILETMNSIDAFKVTFPPADGSTVANANPTGKREPMTNGKANRIIKEFLFSDERFGQWFVHDLHKLADDLTDKLDLPNVVLPWTGGSATIAGVVGGLTTSGSVTVTERGVDADGKKWLRCGNGPKTHWDYSV